MHQKKMTRRFFLASSAAVALSGCASGGKKSLGKMGYKSPNEKLNVAAIGAGGKGGGDIDACKGENVIALCDADWTRAGRTFDLFENAKRYKDFRVMLDKHGDELDACTVSTPDHIHAPAAMACIRNKIGVYVQKPLTHSIMEARALRKAAKKYKVATQMGNQGHSGEGVRQLCEMVWGGAIGQIREVHIWTNRPIWPQGLHKVLPAQRVPETLDWDLWLGPAPYRPYNEGYAPFKWRGWWDYGCGALGDMACHIMDPANWALRLGAPDSVECVYQEGINALTAPNKSVIRYDFPARGKQQKADGCGCRSMDVMAPVTVYWYDGGIMPPRPTDIPEDVQLGDGSNGSLFIGDKGYITTGCYGDKTRLLPEELNNDYTRPDPYIPRSPGNSHSRDWLRACKGGPEACSNFSYSGPFTEVVLLGNLSLRVPGRLLWNQERAKYEKEEFIGREYRKGWTL